MTRLLIGLGLAVAACTPGAPAPETVLEPIIRLDERIAEPRVTGAVA